MVTHSSILFFFFFKFYFIFKLYIIVLILPNIKMNPPQVYMCSPSWTLLPLPSPFHPSGSSQCTSPKHPVSCIEPGLATRFKFKAFTVHDLGCRWATLFRDEFFPDTSHHGRELYRDPSSWLRICRYLEGDWNGLSWRKAKGIVPA